VEDEYAPQERLLVRLCGVGDEYAPQEILLVHLFVVGDEDVHEEGEEIEIDPNMHREVMRSSDGGVEVLNRHGVLWEVSL